MKTQHNNKIPEEVGGEAGNDRGRGEGKVGDQGPVVPLNREGENVPMWSVLGINGISSFIRGDSLCFVTSLCLTSGFLMSDFFPVTVLLIPDDSCTGDLISDSFLTWKEFCYQYV